MSVSQGFDCLHPTIEQRGRIKEDGEATFKVSLQDCLACSGCGISKDEITIISEQNTTKIFEKIDSLSAGYVVLVSTPCVSNLAAVKGWNAQKAFTAIRKIFIEKGAKKVVLETEIEEIWRRLLVKEYIEHDIQTPFLISRCAGSVVYYQRKTTFGSQLAQIKPYPQLFALYEKNILKETDYVIYVGPCYDRKLEAAHFENEIDAVLTISELNEFITEPTDEEVNEVGEISFPEGNDLQYMLQSLNNIQTILNNNEEELLPILQQIEPNMNDDEIIGLINTLKERIGKSEINGESFEGETANKRLTNNIQRGRKIPRICLIDYCKGGCCAGGGLIRGDTPAKRRALIEQTHAIHHENEKGIEFPEEMYKSIIEMGYSTLYESTQEEVKEQSYDW